MGRYSSDSEEEKSRSSRRRRSRSRSPRSRKKKSRRRSRSRSRGRRSRSRSRSHSRSRRHSSSSDRRRSRRSRSRSYEKRRKRHRRSKSRSRSRERKRKGHKRRSRSHSSSQSKDKGFKKDKKVEMPKSEQVKIKMEKALEAATADDSSLKDKVIKSEISEQPTVDPVKQEAIRKIMDEDSFTPAQFISSRSKKQGTDSLLNEKEARKIAEGLSADISTLDVSMKEKIIYKESGSVASHSLFLSQEEKETRWLERLQELRNQSKNKPLP